MKAVKRFIDIGISLILLLLLAPLLIGIGLLIKITSLEPPLFKQERVGKDGKHFVVYKFRTMMSASELEAAGRYITGSENYFTPLGRTLRRWALDELPQLWNVLKGDMSIVGPRPALPYQVEKYDDRQRKRLLMKPGLTGWAQVNGRNKLTWPERIEYDIWYVENWSLWLDFKIMLMTIPALLKKEYAFAEEDMIDDIVRA